MTKATANQEHLANDADVLRDRDSDSKTFNSNNKIVKERIWIIVKLTIQNRVAKVDVETNSCLNLFKKFKTTRANVQEV